MADAAVTPGMAASAAASAVVIPPAVFLGFEAVVLVWAIGGVVMAQAFLPQPKDRSMLQVGLMAAASIIFSAAAAPFAATFVLHLAADIKALATVPVEQYKHASAAICGALAQPMFLLLVSVIKRKAPTVEGAKDA